ncbi:hypothetical protein BJY52DRAFT_1183823 [Lactarius psammicola]|nr:hypothetical protein BJY52DRAFT_1183823 [Lactarius psammicola]
MSCKAESRQRQEIALAEVVADSERSKGPARALPLSLETSCQPRLHPGSLPLPTPRQPSLVLGGFPLQTPHQSHLFLRGIPPGKNTTVTKGHTPTPESAASASAKPNGEPETRNVPDAKNAGETLARTRAPSAAVQDSGVKPDRAATEPMLRLSRHSGDDGWGPAITTGGDADLEGPVRPTLRLDYIREVSTAPTMSASNPGTLADEAPASLLEGDGTKLSMAQNKRMGQKAKKQTQMGEKNTPRPPSGATSHSVDNSVVQEPDPIAFAVVDTYSHWGGRKCHRGCEDGERRG